MKLRNISEQRWKILPHPLTNLLLWLFILSGSSGAVFGQCDLACNGGNPDAPLMVPVNDTCEIDLIPESVLETPMICPGDKVLTVRDTFSNIIVSDTNFVNFDPSLYSGQVLRVTVTDVNTGIFCNSFIIPADTTPPQIICTTDTISCIMDTSAVVLGFPDIQDNCTLSDSLSLSYEDTYIDFGCTGSDVGRLERVWTVMDADSNSNSCTQNIYIDRADLNDVDFPLDTVLSCDVTELNLNVTGQPELFGIIIENTNTCGLTVTYVDDTVSICNDIEHQILRTWTVMETCTGVTATDLQIISVVDTVAPVITCPGPITTSTSLGTCYGTVSLPEPDVIDNCDADATYYVNTSYGQFGLGPHPFVPVGTHSVQYNSVDACGNTSICTTTLNVIDQEAPYAVCEEGTVVSIPSIGYAKVFAYTFDAGSNDNCASELYFKARRMLTGACDQLDGDDSPLPGYQEWFDDELWFCCEEVGETIQVLFRVYEIDPGDGPVVPTRELPGGDLYGHFTECMIEINVQDKIAPVLQCPEDTTINCTDDYSDLTQFGSPVISDNCAFLTDSLEEVSIESCGIGVITRTFFAADPSGNTADCMQLIQVANTNPFSEDNIIWPEEYEIDVCGAATDPDDLPAGFNEPTFINVGCADIGVNHEDEFFDIAFPGCYKILRHWVVVDWCVFDPENPGAGGRFTNTQIIKVEDNIKPVLDCPEDVVKAVTDDCVSATINLDEVTSIDCNANVLITNDAPQAFSNGPDASGIYPLGTTTVKFFASDRCGNVSSCEVNITVEDQAAPSPVCIVGLSINLAMMDGEPMVNLTASSFDGGSHDNCTLDDDLIRTIRVANTGQPDEAPTTSVLTFACEDIGTKVIEFWVSDQLGNSAYCVTEVAIQDNSGICPQQVAGAMITGDVTTEMGAEVEEVMIEMMNTNAMMAYTGADGFFEILDVPIGENYSLRAKRDNDPLNGISTFDLILISRHILGVNSLGSPYKLIAADVNRSGNISTLDLISLRKLILGVEASLPNNTSWRFIPADYIFPNPNNPFALPFPEKVDIYDLAEDYVEVNFVAVKVGDVDNSASPNNLLDIEGRSFAGALELNVTEQELKAGQEITLSFTSDQLEHLLGYQFSLGFDTELLDYIELTPGTIEGMGEDNFNLSQAEDGLIKTSWSIGKTMSEVEDNTLFTLSLKAKVPLESLQGLVYISQEEMAVEAYREDGTFMDIGLKFNKLTLTSAQRALDFEVYQNHPNPFREETTIGFDLPESGQTVLNVFDLKGQVVYHSEAYFEKGYNEVKVSSTDLGNSGIYYYQVGTKGHSTTKKMILVQ
jgi:hypothetical protein